MDESFINESVEAHNIFILSKSIGLYNKGNYDESISSINLLLNSCAFKQVLAIAHVYKAKALHALGKNVVAYINFDTARKYFSDTLNHKGVVNIDNQVQKFIEEIGETEYFDKQLL